MTGTWIFTRLLSLVVSVAIARDPTVDPCAGVPGGCPPVNMLANIATPIAELLFVGAAGTAVLFVVIGGAQMILSLGDDSKGLKGKMTVIYALSGFALAMASQTIVHYVHVNSAGLATSDLPILDAMATVVRMMVSLMNIAFAAVAIYGGVRLVLAFGKQEESGKVWNMIIWSIIGAVVINVAGSLVRAVTYTGLT